MLQVEDADKVRERCDAWMTVMRKLVNENRTDLQAFAQRERDAIAVDTYVFALNVIAFFGYLVFPATYFGPFLREPRLEWFGTFAGDLAWTVCLTLPRSLALN